MPGYMGNIAYVDLNTGEVEVRKPGDSFYRKFIGGRGLAAAVLYEELDPGVDPLSPENVFVLATGPLAGTRIPGGTRHITATKSPLTGGWGEANAAGRMGPMLKAAGLDAIVVRGRASRPSFLWVREDGIEVVPCDDLWGMDTGAARDAIIARTHPQAEVATIGVAGENQVKYACVMSEYSRAAGRSGTGAVLGSKMLKGIAVWGEREVEIKDPEGLRQLRQTMVKEIMEHPNCQMFREHGTPGGIVPHDKMGAYPAYNFKEGVSDSIENVSGETMTNTILIRRDACDGCPVACRRVVDTGQGQFSVDSRYGGPEFETIGALGTCTGLYDLKAIAKANELSNRLGMDTINIGLIIAYVMECYERGLLTSAHTDGLTLDWGDAGAILELIQRVAHRKGRFATILGEGLAPASRWVGQKSEDFALHVKNQAFPVHMPRGKIGQGLSYATSNRGACHCQGMHDNSVEAGKISPAIGIDERFKGLSRMSKDLKPELEAIAQNFRAFQDSLIICRFVAWDYGAATPESVLEMLNAVTGWDVTPEESMLTGERIFNLCRLFNAREGMNRKDDTLPARMGESLPRGATKGSVITPQDLDRLLDDYYEFRGWTADGCPSEDTIERLDLGDVVAR